MRKFLIVFSKVFFAVSVVCAYISLLFPYLIRSNFRMEYLKESVLIEEFGFEYEFAFLSLALLTAAFFLAVLYEKFIWCSGLLLLNLLAIIFLRFSIHHQCCFDHDFDTQSGLGFKILFYSSLIVFLPLILLFWQKQKFQ